MCDVLDRIELKGRQEGRREGRQEGRKEGRAEQAKKTTYILKNMGLSIEQIAQAVDTNIDTVKQWLSASPAKS